MELLDDLQAMRLALDWAARGMYITSPNPRVGCVLLKDGRLLAAGHTQPPGSAHAEAAALQDAQARGIDVKGATAYVTLEPCSHFGRTPPCADALVRAGVARVVVAVRDPNPLVAGQGLEKLRAAGIAVEVGLLEQEARELNIGFMKRMETGRPWVRMKAAASLDGKTALFDGSSQWITSQAARDDGHAWRARADAILTGIGTVQEDDPQMNVRAIDVPRQPQRIVVDSRLQIEASARILAGGGALVIAAEDTAERRAKAHLLDQGGTEVLFMPNAQGKVDLPALIAELGRRHINELHVEAGFKLNGSLIREACVDELLLYLAPNLLGEARGLYDLGPLDSLEHKRELAFHDIQRVGNDLRILARFAARPTK